MALNTMWGSVEEMVGHTRRGANQHSCGRRQAQGTGAGHHQNIARQLQTQQEGSSFGACRCGGILGDHLQPIA